MAHAVNAGRASRPAPFVRSLPDFALVARHVFDGYDLYIAGGVLASAVQTKFSTVPQNCNSFR